MTKQINVSVARAVDNGMMIRVRVDDLHDALKDYLAGVIGMAVNESTYDQDLMESGTHRFFFKPSPTGAGLITSLPLEVQIDHGVATDVIAEQIMKSERFIGEGFELSGGGCISVEENGDIAMYPHRKSSED